MITISNAENNYNSAYKNSLYTKEGNKPERPKPNHLIRVEKHRGGGAAETISVLIHNKKIISSP